MQIALSTPTARVAWRQYLLETEQDESRLVRERLEQERKQEVLRINSTITHRPPPSALGDWQPPSPSRTAGGWGECLDKAPPEDLVSKEWQLAKAARERGEAQLKVDLEIAEQAESDWWAWYLRSKEETQREAALQAERERLAEERRLARLEAERQAKMELMRKEELARKAKLKADAERVEKANAEQRQLQLQIEEEERKRKKEEERKRKAGR
jgi:hypothetical protein